MSLRDRIGACRIGACLTGLVLSLGALSARAGVVAVVSAASPINALARSEVADIFLGKTGRFPNGGAAVPIDLPEGSSLRDEFYAAFAAKSPAQLKAHWSKIIFTGRGQPPRAVDSAAAMKKLIARDPHAIGYLEQSELDRSVKALVTH